ncbi:MAG: hypothetical protein U0361_04715 [Nitrospiraceae bacterium]
MRRRQCRLARRIDLAIEDYQRISTTLLSPLALAELTAMGQAADHQVRVQYVMGRNLVNETRRGVRSGLLSPMYYGSAFNAEVIRRTEALGRRMDEQFEAGRQPMLGRMIAESAQEETRLDAAAQERIALAVISKPLPRLRMRRRRRPTRRNSASATSVAAIRSNALQERLDRLAMFDAGGDRRQTRCGPHSHHAGHSLRVSDGGLPGFDCVVRGRALARAAAGRRRRHADVESGNVVTPASIHDLSGGEAGHDLGKLGDW